MRLLLLLTSLLFAAPAGAREPEWRWANQQEILLSPFAYEPKTIRVERDRPVKLRFVNNGRSTLVFEAKDFFRSARVRSGSDEAAVADGRIRLGPGEQVTVALVPAPGDYHVRSSNIFHRLLGMTGRIVVE